jgi:hypothetical protein
MVLHCERVGSTSRSRRQQDGDRTVSPAIEMKDLVLNHRSHIARYKQNAEERGDRPKIRQIRTGHVSPARVVEVPSGVVSATAPNMREKD